MENLTKKFEEIAPFLYREVHGQDHVGFKKNSAGHWQFQLDYPFFIFQRVGLFENKHCNFGVLIFGLVVTGLTVLLWPVAAITRKHYGKKLEYSPSESKLRLLVRAVCVLLLVFFAGWLAVLSLSDDPKGINGLPPWIILFGIWTKLHDLALALACLGLIWFAFTWNLMNFNVHY